MKNNSAFITQHSSFAAGVGIPFETKMTEMAATLFSQMKESAKLDEVIRQNLKGLGYEE
jgi:type I restriction enzyme M protein